MISHGTPVTLDARPNLLKISESASQKELMRRLAQNFRPKIQARELNPSKAWARKIPTLTRPITTLTVSIIANILAAPRTDRTTAALHSQKDSNGEIEDRK